MHHSSASRTVSIGRHSPNRPYQVQKGRDTMQKKNVDYAAYEYNVYVRCNNNGRKQQLPDSEKTAGRGALITIINTSSQGEQTTALSMLLAPRKKRI